MQTDSDRDYFPSAAQLEAAAVAAAARGTTPRALLLTNPTNPFGTVIEPTQYAEAVDWAVDRGIHVVSDEIYACSIFGDPGPESMPEFVSAWTTDA